jgi:hypothetical protein
MLEVFQGHKYDAPSQRRPHGHVAIRGTKRGNKKRSLRAQSTSLDEELECEDDDEDDQ